MKVFYLIFALAGCTTKPVTDFDWLRCEMLCDEDDGLKEACHSSGVLGCTCFNEKTLWIYDECE